jgi:hypothetical protein
MSLDILEPWGPVQACKGIALPILIVIPYTHRTVCTFRHALPFSQADGIKMLGRKCCYMSHTGPENGWDSRKQCSLYRLGFKGLNCTSRHINLILCQVLRPSRKHYRVNRGYEWLSTSKRFILGSCYIGGVTHDAVFLFVLIGASCMQSTPRIGLNVLAPPSI